ncbi:MAG TPA: cold-shock protein [Candidatus Hydrogenedentes bacterium]|jgi:CspA family cold shock protein|nr:cold-shock protein [Candidatus Hydrogenedentota bacterium]MDY0030628.1 cold-shock protein [FCB group bacterium]NLT62072.1 cold-shock protein [Candidatus Hydrogenedentota bacterium]HNZ19671.1 cold-shock protein [Candidatus Hydrogenedentota bacterium]HOH34130.1 cold-shock protein [Candidatus Hydrogenedentota bacterium]
MPTGTVKWFNEQKGYGFIIPDEGGKDIFVHRSNVATVNRTLKENEKVVYEVGDGRKGPEAKEVRTA